MEFLKLLRLTVILSIILSLYSCTVYRLSSRDQLKSGYTGSMIKLFRELTFFQILGKAYEGTNAFEEIRKRDLMFPPREAIFDSKVIYPAIDSIATKFIEERSINKKMREESPDSPDIVFHKEYYSREYYFRYALDFYDSSELDSLACHYLKKSDRRFAEQLKLERKGK